MPKGDRTGPLGEGPQTGRHMGYCVGNEHPGFFYGRSGRRSGLGSRFRGSYGRGFGPVSGYGFGNLFYERIPDVSRKTMIENEIRILKDQLSSLEDQLSKIEEK